MFAAYSCHSHESLTLILDPDRNPLQDEYRQQIAIFWRVQTDTKMEPSVESSDSGLLALPRELRNHILRYLLRLPPAASTIGRSRTLLSTDELSNQPCLEWNLEGHPVAPMRRHLEQPRGIHTEILRTCRQLCEEGLSLIAEEPIVALCAKVFIPHEIEEIDVFVRKHSYRCQSSATPVMTLWVVDERDEHEMQLYLFELCDLPYIVRLLVRYLQWRCKRASLDVYIHRLYVPGICETNTAAKTLFVDTIHPYLNGYIRQVALMDSRQAARVDSVRRPDDPHHARCLPDALSTLVKVSPCVHQDEVIKVSRQIVTGVNLHFSEETQGLPYDPRPALEVWKSINEDLSQLSSTGRWFRSDDWETVAHQSLWMMNRQIPLSLLTSSVPELWSEINDQRDRLRMLTMVIYLTLSYLPPSPGASYSVNKHNQLCRSGLELAERACSEGHNINNAIDGNSDQAANIYVWLLEVEASARTRSHPDGVGHAWVVLRNALERLRRNTFDHMTRQEWAMDMMLQAKRLSREYKKREGGAHGKQRWRRDGCFRGRFFRALNKDFVVPMVIEKYGEEDGSFFRDVVSATVGEWKVL